MLRTILPLTVLVVVATHFADARAAEPGFVGIETYLPPPQSSLSSSTAKAIVNNPSPMTMPDLHLSTAFKAPPATATMPATLPNFASGQIVWTSHPAANAAVASSRPTASSVSEFVSGANPHADASSLLLTGIGGQSPSTGALVTPALLRDTGASLASPSLYMPPANYLQDNHPLLGH